MSKRKRKWKRRKFTEEESRKMSEGRTWEDEIEMLPVTPKKPIQVGLTFGDQQEQSALMCLGATVGMRMDDVPGWGASQEEMHRAMKEGEPIGIVKLYTEDPGRPPMELCFQPEDIPAMRRMLADLQQALKAAVRKIGSLQPGEIEQAPPVAYGDPAASRGDAPIH